MRTSLERARTEYIWNGPGTRHSLDLGGIILEWETFFVHEITNRDALQKSTEALVGQKLNHAA